MCAITCCILTLCDFFFLLLYQFKLLPELFQDEEKVISPTSATSSGRVPLSQTPVKPAKARPGQTSKEHKKTVGHQVSLRMQLCEIILLFTFLCPVGLWIG